MSEPMDKREEVELPVLDITPFEKSAAMHVPSTIARPYVEKLLCRERQLEAALAANREKDAEIERLKIELAKTGTGDYKGDFYLGRKTLSGYLRDAEDDRDGWKRMYDDKKSELASLRASGRDTEFMQQNAKDIGALLKDAIYPGQKLDNIYALIRHALIYVNIQLDRVAPPTRHTEKE